jgi:hypothetical protein
MKVGENSRDQLQKDNFKITGLTDAQAGNRQAVWGRAKAVQSNNFPFHQSSSIKTTKIIDKQGVVSFQLHFSEQLRNRKSVQ